MITIIANYLHFRNEKKENVEFRMIQMHCHSHNLETGLRAKSEVLKNQKLIQIPNIPFMNVYHSRAHFTQMFVITQLS